jgi:hypothetical protein
LLIIVTIIIATIQIISYTHDFLSFESHFEIKIQNPIYDSIRLPSFRHCLNAVSFSKFRINQERIKYNISRDFDLYSLLLNRTQFNAKEFFKCGVKVEFYEFTDDWNKNCSEFEEYVETEIHSVFGSKSNEFFYCFSYDTKNLRTQSHLSKSSLFLKISFPINFSNSKLVMRFELINAVASQALLIKASNWYNTALNSVMKSSITYLQNPYKSQCSYYDTNQSPFNSVSFNECLHKCTETNCFLKYKCVKQNYERVIRRLDESLYDSVECNETEHKNCNNVYEKCTKICPIDCLTENYYFSSYVEYHEDRYLNTQYNFWDSREAFILYKETEDILLIDYLTYIGGLFGLWLGICLESLLDLIVKHTTNLRTKVKLRVDKLLSFIYLFSFCILHCINDLNRSFINYTLEKVLSIKNIICQFRIWLSDWLEILFDIILTHARIWRFKLKLCVKKFFSFALILIQLLIVLFLSLIFCSKSMFETQVKKLLLLVYAFFNYILRCIHDVILMCINCVQNRNYCTNNRVESINL